MSIIMVGCNEVGNLAAVQTMEAVEFFAPQRLAAYRSSAELFSALCFRGLTKLVSIRLICAFCLSRGRLRLLSAVRPFGARFLSVT